jgi:arylsulfatase A-like enzyme
MLTCRGLGWGVGDHLRAPRCVRGENPPIGHLVRPRRGNEGDETLDELGRALAWLAAAAPDAVVVYTSDHGEELGEHGGWEHGHALWEEVVRVPLAMAGPGVPTGRFSGPASIVDIRATVLALVGVPVGEHDGVDLRGVLPDRALVLAGTLYEEERGGLVRWPWKLTRTLAGDEVRLVDLAADPGERVDVGHANPEVVTTLTRALDAERARLGDTPVGTLGESLRALGYVE